MKHNTKIPGWNSQEILTIIGEHAANVPEGGHILELGALFGRSTYTLGYNKKPSVKLITIDLWPSIDFSNHTEKWIHDDSGGAEEHALVRSSTVMVDGKETLPGLEFHRLWSLFTKGITNNIGIREFTNTTNTHYPMFDFIFHDAAHDYKGVYEDLVHWFPKLLPHGVIIIDDYDPVTFPGVVDATNQFVDENNLHTEMVTGRNILLRRKA